MRPKQERLTQHVVKALIAAAKDNEYQFAYHYKLFTDYRDGIANERGYCVECGQDMLLHTDMPGSATEPPEVHCPGDSDYEHTIAENKQIKRDDQWQAMENHISF